MPDVPGTVAVAAAVVVVVAIVIIVLVAATRVWMRRRDVHCFRTMAGRAWVIPSYDGQGRSMRVLRVGGGTQSATYVDEELWTVPPGAYIRCFDLVFDAAIPVRDVLMLGGGGFSYPKHLISTHPEARIDVVEIDPVITAIARRWFFLDRLVVEYETDASGRLGIFEQDALEYLREHDAMYDAIVNDTFSGREPARELMTPQALALLRTRLRPGGIYVTNVVAPAEGRGSEVLRQTVEACGKAFPQVAVVPCTTRDRRAVDNRLVVAGDADLAAIVAKWAAPA